MRAMVLERPREPLRLIQREPPRPGRGEVLVDVAACAVCRTELHVMDGELPDLKLPLIPGHQIVGHVVATGPAVDGVAIGDRVGVPWLGWTCGACRRCTTGRENLCDDGAYLGYQRDGGYADQVVADHRFCLRLPDRFPDVQAAPLLCAGIIGYRALRLAGDPENVGIYGFGGAAHIVAQVARYEGRRIFAFTRRGDHAAQAFALELGAVWAGAIGDRPPEELDAALVFAPVGEAVYEALRVLGKGGTVVCGGIHMTDIPALPYELLWGERTICSVANLTVEDGEALLGLAARMPVHTEVTEYPLERANEALDRLRAGHRRGSVVLRVAPAVS
jgi:propanol-preferring alcohol dehydrogenase